MLFKYYSSYCSNKKHFYSVFLSWLESSKQSSCRLLNGISILSRPPKANFPDQKSPIITARQLFFFSFHNSGRFLILRKSRLIFQTSTPIEKNPKHLFSRPGAGKVKFKTFADRVGTLPVSALHIKFRSIYYYRANSEKPSHQVSPIFR